MLLLLSEKSASEAKLSDTPCKIKQVAEQEADVAPEAKGIKVEHTTESPNNINDSQRYGLVVQALR